MTRDLQKRTVLVTLDRERALRWTINGMAEVEKLTGLPVSDVLTKAFEEGRISFVRAILFGLLYHEDPSIKPETVGKWMDEIEDLPKVIEGVVEAVQLGINPGGGAPELAQGEEDDSKKVDGSGTGEKLAS